MLRSATRENCFARRVLLVDHYDPILETLLLELRCAGSMVMVAHSDQEAVELAKTFRPELLVTKVTLPVIGDLAEAVEIKRWHPECKVVLLSFWDIEADTATTLMAGDFTFHLLCRAEHPADLLAHVAAVFHDRTNERPAPEANQTQLKENSVRRQAMQAVSEPPMANVSSEASPVDETQAIPQDPSLESQVRARAYELFEQRGMTDGHALEDWLQAEQEICRPSPLVMAKAA